MYDGSIVLTHDKQWLLYEIVEELFVASYIKVVENIFKKKVFSLPEPKFRETIIILSNLPAGHDHYQVEGKIITYLNNCENLVIPLAVQLGW